MRAGWCCRDPVPRSQYAIGARGGGAQAAAGTAPRRSSPRTRGPWSSRSSRRRWPRTSQFPSSRSRRKRHCCTMHAARLAPPAGRGALQRSHSHTTLMQTAPPHGGAHRRHGRSARPINMTPRPWRCNTPGAEHRAAQRGGGRAHPAHGRPNGAVVSRPRARPAPPRPGCRRRRRRRPCRRERGGTRATLQRCARHAPRMCLRQSAENMIIPL